MTLTTPAERFMDGGVQGKLGKPFEYGQKTYGYGYYGEEEIKIDNQRDTPLTRWGIYQKRHSNWILVGGKKKYFGRVKYIREEFYQGYGIETAAMKATRDNFKNGVIAWWLLTNTQRQEYNIRAKKLKVYGYNLFMKEWLKSH